MTLPANPNTDWTSYDLLPVGIIIVSRDYTILSWNSCIAGWTGIPREEIVGTNLLRRFASLDKPRYLSRIEQVFSGGPAVIFSSQFHPHFIPSALTNGDLRIQSVTVVPLQAGPVFHAMIVIEDVTDLTRQVRMSRKMRAIAEKELEERRKAERAIIEALEFNRAIVENSPVGIITYAADGRCISANGSAGAILGTTSEFLKTQNFHKIDSWKRSGLHDMAVTALQEIRPVSREVHISTTFGKNMWFSLVCTPFHSAGEMHLLVMFEDITDRKRAEDALVLVNRKLTLLSSITRHDILNQLMALRAYIELVRDRIADPETLEYLAKGEYAASIIEAQIEFSRSYQSIGVKAPAWQDVRAIVREAVHPIVQKEIPVEISLPDVEVFADPMLPRVFYNIMENAVRHSGKMTRFSVTGTESRDGFSIVCLDDGIGIPNENKEKIFRREYFRHTGLGLYLSREILSITGITIRENGTPDNGARFEILVPWNSYRIVH